MSAGAPLSAETASAWTAGYEALWHGLGAVALDRAVVRVSGPDSERYLQGQLSQDVAAAMAPGSWAWALVLAPQGKLDAFLRVYRVAPDEYLLDTDAVVVEAMVARLLRFRLRTKADVERLDWRVLAVRGATAGQPPPGTVSGPEGPVGEPPEGALALPFAWGGLRGFDLLGRAPTAPENALAVSRDAYEAARIEAGFPVHDAELDERTIPAEAGLVEASVSFTKGCYTGQELVARIDSRGNNVPRRLRGLLLEGPVAPGSPLWASKEVGRVTSVARSPERGWVALAYVGRAVEVGATLAVGPAPGESAGPQAEHEPALPASAVQARVVALPFSGPGAFVTAPS
jgi:folate-binding protein YgfZ